MAPFPPAVPRTSSLRTSSTAPRTMCLAREVPFEAGTRLFQQGRHADRCRIVRTGTAALGLRVPGRRPAVIESLGHGEPVGWPWHFAPHIRQPGGEAVSPVRAWEFDAEAVRALGEQDPEFGRAGPPRRTAPGRLRVVSPCLR